MNIVLLEVYGLSVNANAAVLLSFSYMGPHSHVLTCFASEPIFFNYYLTGSFSVLLVVVLSVQFVFYQ